MSDTTTGGATATRPLLALKGMSKSFGAVEAMKDVDLEVRPGEVMGLLGDNGAGKSTLIKAIAGVQPADTARPHSRVKAFSSTRPKPRRTSGSRPCTRTSRCARTSTSSPTSTWVKRLERQRFVLDETSMEQKTAEFLGSLGVTTIRSVRTEVERLSVASARRLRSRALCWASRSSSSRRANGCTRGRQTAHILEMIERLRDRGLGVIVISHNLADVFKVADRVTVYGWQGRRHVRHQSSSHEEIVAAITGAEFGNGERPTEEAPL